MLAVIQEVCMQHNARSPIYFMHLIDTLRVTDTVLFLGLSSPSLRSCTVKHQVDVKCEHKLLVKLVFFPSFYYLRQSR